MRTMTIKELFDVGVSFESSVGEGTRSERDRIPKNYSRINLPDEMILNISEINKEINFLISGEIWCPDYQLNATVLKKFTELNSKFNISVISMARGKKFLAPLLGLEDPKWPIITVLDKDFNILGIFNERPKPVRAFSNFDDIKLDYYKGKYLLDAAYEFLEMINKAK
ncbi:thioredoxin family protein [Romboutsia sp. Marseille-P6047]|uniref:thioredoxin family protein n=1 Tax=Romboutsia sp. Marseille-P6047 TaxID=2161817 RepID=UPI000F05EF1C|nr:thioredoxin family protein [Romboutsia sp. Marseille-P6047]